MEHFPIPVCAGEERDLLLARCNAAAAPGGLSLTGAELDELLEGRARALRDSGRVELGDGILAPLSAAFASSPYLEQAHWAETLDALQSCFYRLKSEARETLDDDELLEGMRRAFDGPAGGDPDYLAGLSPEELWLGAPPPEGCAWEE